VVAHVARQECKALPSFAIYQPLAPKTKMNKTKKKPKKIERVKDLATHKDVLLSIDGGCSGSGCGAAAAKRCYDHGG
jgi:hypothetical protein